MHPLEKRNILTEDLQSIRTLDEYKARGGMLGLEKAQSMTPENLIAFVKESGLRGRGGAGFPTAIKWDTVYHDPEPKKFLVCNGAEGEPGTYKDRYFILKNPYQLWEGMLIAAYAIDAHQAIIGTKAKFKPQLERLYSSLKEMENAGYVEPGFLRLVEGPDDYLFGEEKAMLEVIDGRGAMPRNFPPFMAGVGAGAGELNPTVVNNAESLSHLPRILAKGTGWFKSMGTQDTPGTVILTLSGDLKRPGMYEVATGITVRQALYDLAGGPLDGREFMAIYSGVANRVMTPDLFDLKIEFGSLRQAGVGLGSGGFIVYDNSKSIVRICHMLSKFLADSSCGQCIPCNMGSRVITEHLTKLCEGHGTMDDIEAIMAECGRCTNQTRCFLPQQESNLVSSTVNKFRKDFEYCAQGNAAPACELVLPKIESFDEAAGKFIYEKSKVMV